MTGCGPDQVHRESGFCFGIDDPTTANSFDGKNTVQDDCEVHGSLAIVNTESKKDFLVNSAIFDGITLVLELIYKYFTP